MISIKNCFFTCVVLAGLQFGVKSQQKLTPTPPMSWMTCNYFADNSTENDIREMADAILSHETKMFRLKN